MLWNFSRQEYLSVWTFPPPGDLSNPGIEPLSPPLQVDSLPLSHQGIITLGTLTDTVQELEFGVLQDPPIVKVLYC